MKLVIDIDEEMYKQVIASDIIYVLDDNIDLIMLENAIANGTPLQAELEEIKAEIEKDLEEARERMDNDSYNYKYFSGKLNANIRDIAILDKHIKEIDNETNN